MKFLSKNFCLLIFIFLGTCYLHSQETYLPDSSSYRTEIHKIGSYNAGSTGLYPNNSILHVGTYTAGDIKYRAYYEWDIPDAIIPDASQIDSIRLFIIYSPYNGNLAADVLYYSLDGNLLNTNIDTLWNQMNWKSPVGTGYGNQYGYNISGNDTINSLFSSNSSFVTAFKTALTDNRFILGIKKHYENIDGAWSFDIASMRLKVYYHAPATSVMVDQKTENNSSVDSVSHWEGTSFVPYPVPHTFSFPLTSTQYLLADTNIVNQDGTQKFNNWENYDNVINYSGFSINTTTTEIVSRLNKTSSPVLRNNLENSSQLDGGNIILKDPWFRDSLDSKGLRNRGVHAIDRSRPSPFTPDNTTQYEYGQTHKGFFFYQGWPYWTPPYYSIKAISPQPISVNGVTHNFYFQNWNVNNTNYTTVQDTTALATGIVIKDAGAVIQANFKGTQLTNDQNGFISNSQRKIVSTTYVGGVSIYNLIYPSMGKLWHDQGYWDSGNENWVWELQNNNKPVSTGTAKNPAIDYKLAYNGDRVGAVYQEQVSTYYKIVLYINTPGEVQDGLFTDVYTETDDYYTNDANPVIAWAPGFSITGYTENIMVLWKRSVSGNGRASGYYCKIGYLNDNQIVWRTGNPVFIPNTDINSLHATAASDKNLYGVTSPTVIHFAYEQQNPSEGSSAIMYRTLTTDKDSIFSAGTLYNVSSGGGYLHNTIPSIIWMGSQSARICWLGDMYYIEDEGGGGGGLGKSKYMNKETSYNDDITTVFADPGYANHYWNFGTNVNSPTICKVTDKSNTFKKYLIAWSEEDGSNSYVVDNTLSSNNIHSLGTTGQDIQISNGFLDQTESLNDTRAMALNKAGTPYIFNNSGNVNNLFNFNKENALGISSGRQGLVYKDSAKFYFNIGDIKVNAHTINFINIPDTISINSLQSVNTYLVSEPFTLSNNSNFIYSVQYGVVQPSAAGHVLQENESVNFKVEIIDSQTEGVISIYDDVTFDKGHLTKYNNFTYTVNTAGIGNRTVKLKLVLNNNFNSHYSVSEKYAVQSTLPKANQKQINYKGNLVVINYALNQNFPNPFNPTTNINYQIPKAGLVTIKVYDILGKAVATLVHEQKESGSYNVQFNGSSFASGVYIYELRVNDYSALRKMLLIK